MGEKLTDLLAVWNSGDQFLSPQEMFTLINLFQAEVAQLKRKRRADTERFFRLLAASAKLGDKAEQRAEAAEKRVAELEQEIKTIIGSFTG